MPEVATEARPAAMTAPAMSHAELVKPIAELPRASAHPALAEAPAPVLGRTEPTLPPWLRLRVVHASGETVAGAQIVIRMSGPPGFKSSVIRAKAESDGRYTETRNFRAECTIARIDVALADGAAKFTHELKVPSPVPAIWDVGDLPIQATRIVLVTVVDASGAPISGASVVRKKNDSIPLTTNSSGAVLVDVAGDTRRLFVAAAGFDSTTANLSTEGSRAELEELRVVLSRVAVLAIRVTPPLDRHFDARITLSYTDTPELGAWRERDVQRLRPRSDADVQSDGICLWRGVPAGVNLHAELKSHGTRLALVEIRPLLPAEQREEVLKIDALPQNFIFRVVGPGGEKVKQASVELAAHLGFRGMHLSTDDQGKAQVELFEPAVLDIRVWGATGFATLELHAVALTEKVLTLQLEYERFVEVELVDIAGQPYTGAQSIGWRQFSNTGHGGQRIGPSQWRLNCLPSGFVVIDADHHTSILHDTSMSTARLVIGHKGRIRIQYAGERAIELDNRPAWETGREWSVRVRSLTDAAYSTRVIALPFVGHYAEFNGLSPGRYEAQLEVLLPGNLPRWIADSEPEIVEVDDSPVPVVLTFNR